MPRIDGRSSRQPRPIRLVPDFIKGPLGSCLVEQGDTKVLCTVSVEETLPHFLRNATPAQGWLTAEYSMLPGSTGQRTKRERTGASGRTQEIQRLIGRALRGVIDLRLCPELTLTVDCDVLQADGGTRTASITGAYVALKLATTRLMQKHKLRHNPLTGIVAAVSVGLVRGELLVDLCYEEDARADLDMNVVITGEKKILEIQGTGERAAFTKDEVIHIIDASIEAITPIFDLQTIAADGRIAES